MERVVITYDWDDTDKNGMNDTKKIVMQRAQEDGLHDYEICEMFRDFMNAVGFSENNVYKYFRD